MGQWNGYKSLLSLSIAIWIGVSGCASSSVKKNGKRGSTAAFEALDIPISEEDIGDSGEFKADLDGDAEETASTEELAEAIEFEGLSDESLAAIKDIEQQILTTDQKLEPAPHRIPLGVNRNVRKWIHFFVVKDAERFQRFMDRGSAYEPLVKSILEKYGVPTDLYYLGLIESGYAVHAKSHARAVGPWQFMRGTGRQYGLKQLPGIDERRDIVRSTESAARYLKDLYREFDSWYLALSAYNAGPGRIRGAIRRGGTRDFWAMVQNGVLPRETANYVPKFLAARIVAERPEKYGFRSGNRPEFPDVKAHRVRGGSRLSQVARHFGVSSTLIRSLNPHILSDQIPTRVGSYAVWVPEELQRSDIQSVFDEGAVSDRPEISPRKAVARKSFRRQHLTKRVHRVKRGEGLIQIARLYGTSVSKLKRNNALKGSKIFVGQRIVVR